MASGCVGYPPCTLALSFVESQLQSAWALLLDRPRNRVIRFFNRTLYPGDTFTREVVGLTAIWNEISTDGGRTFAEPGR